MSFSQNFLSFVFLKFNRFHIVIQNYIRLRNHIICSNQKEQSSVEIHGIYIFKTLHMFYSLTA